MNQPTKRVLLIFFAISIAGALVAVVLVPHNVQKAYIAKNCPTFVSRNGFADPTDFVDCRGVIGIERYVKEKYPTVFVDSPITNSSIDFQVRVFRFSGNYLYYREDLNLTLKYYVHSASDNSYSLSLPIGGKNETVTFSSTQDIPIFRKVDTNTGNFTLYKVLDDVPVDERNVFQQLLSAK